MAQDSLAVTTTINDSLSTTKSKKKFSIKRYFQEDYPSPKKAITLAIIPGMGQIYNKKYWKLPLVYGALGGIIYLIDYNTSRYNLYRKLYDVKRNEIRRLTDPDVNENESPYYNEFVESPTFPISVIQNTSELVFQPRRNAFDRRRQLSWIGLIGFYIISAGDAFVDAHLKDFNTDDNISLEPTFQTSDMQTSVVGLSLKINISK